MIEWAKGYWQTVAIYGVLLSIIVAVFLLAGVRALPTIVGLLTLLTVSIFVGGLSESRKTGLIVGTIAGLGVGFAFHFILVNFLPISS